MLGRHAGAGPAQGSPQIPVPTQVPPPEPVDRLVSHVDAQLAQHEAALAHLAEQERQEQRIQENREQASALHEERAPMADVYAAIDLALAAVTADASMAHEAAA